MGKSNTIPKSMYNYSTIPQTISAALRISNSISNHLGSGASSGNLIAWRGRHRKPKTQQQQQPPPFFPHPEKRLLFPTRSLRHNNYPFFLEHASYADCSPRGRICKAAASISIGATFGISEGTLINMQQRVPPSLSRSLTLFFPTVLLVLIVCMHFTDCRAFAGGKRPRLIHHS